MRKASILCATALFAVLNLSSAGVAYANTTFTDASGGYSAGIGPNGELYDSTTGIGLQNPNGDDYIRPGTPRDSWGITSSAGSAFADYQDFGASGIVNTSFSLGANSATYVSSLANGLTLTQLYNFFAPNILSIQETVANTGLIDISGIVFRRDVDLDIPPTLFNENVVGVFGSNPNVVGNSVNGFETPDPAFAFTSPCGTTCNTAGDLGAGIDFNIGTLTAGSSNTFAYYYGINQPGQGLTGLFSQAQGLGLSYLIGAQSRENGDYPNLGGHSAFLGVSNVGAIAGAVPEPATWAMMLAGFGIIGFAARRRQSVKTTLRLA